VDRKSEFALNKIQRIAITVDDLASLVLHIVQSNESGLGGRISYMHGQLSSIKAFEVFNNETDKSDPAFETKWAEAVQSLFRRGMIMKNPDQGSDDFVILTEAGCMADTSTPLVGVWQADRFLKHIEDTSGPLDPVVRQYLEESYRSASEDLWLAATFMLGAASERALYLLSETIAGLVGDAGPRKKLENCRTVRAVKEWILEQLPLLRKTFPEAKPVLSDIEDKITTLLTLYRYQRNEIGHPRDDVLTVEPDKIRAMLKSFSTYWAVVVHTGQLRAK
jgi:hypothetical protein